MGHGVNLYNVCLIKIVISKQFYEKLAFSQSNAILAADNCYWNLFNIDYTF